jgi:hypothetical protein
MRVKIGFILLGGIFMGCWGGGTESPPTTCGNGKIDHKKEECDGEDLGRRDCLSLGYAGGRLGCNVNCKFNTSGCYGEVGPLGKTAVCGDGKVELEEDCEPGVKFTETCESLGKKLGFEWKGTLLCDEHRCQWDTAKCEGDKLDPYLGHLIVPLKIDCDLYTSKGCAKNHVCFWYYSPEKGGYTTCVAPRSMATSYVDCSGPGRGCAVGHGCYRTRPRSREALCLKYCRLNGNDCGEGEVCRDEGLKVPPPNGGVCVRG